MAEIKLKPCPFCGDKAHMMTNKMGSKNVYYVHCMSRKCPVNPYTDEFKSISDAAYWWNKRADTNESIVHCKDCKYLTCTISSNHFMYFPTNDYECGKAILDGYVNPEDFCSRGERRE